MVYLSLKACINYLLDVGNSLVNFVGTCIISTGQIRKLQYEEIYPTSLLFYKTQIRIRYILFYREILSDKNFYFSSQLSEGLKGKCFGLVMHT